MCGKCSRSEMANLAPPGKVSTHRGRSRGVRGGAGVAGSRPSAGRRTQRRRLGPGCSEEARNLPEQPGGSLGQSQDFTARRSPPKELKKTYPPPLRRFYDGTH